MTLTRSLPSLRRRHRPMFRLHLRQQQQHQSRQHHRPAYSVPRPYSLRETFRLPAYAERQLPRSEDCYACHRDHAAVDNTFVQFYPLLMDVAKQKGTFKP